MRIRSVILACCLIASFTNDVLAQTSPPIVNQLVGDYQDNTSDAANNITTASAMNGGATFSTQGYASLSFQIVSNTSTNVVAIEGSNDGGTTWAGIALRTVNTTGSSGNAGTFIGSSLSGTTYVPTVVMPMMRWRISTYNSGSTTIATGFKRTTAPNSIDAFVGNTIRTAPLESASTYTAASVGTSSAQALAAASRNYMYMQNVSATASIACRTDGGTAALNTAGSFMLPPLTSRAWDSNAVPNGQINCIASAASTPLTIEVQ